jgi:predicted permease
MSTWIRELRFAFRGLRRSPVFTATSLIVLALASGTLTVVLSVVDGVLVRPLPVVAQDELVIAWKEDYKAGFAHFPFTYSSVEYLKGQLRTVSDLATIDYNGGMPFTTVNGDQATKISTSIVSGGFFNLLGVRPVIGRLFVPADDVPGGRHLVVLGEQWWRTHFEGDRHIIGKTMSIFGTPHEIIGIVPRDFAYPNGAAVWTLMLPWPNYGANNDVVNQDIVARLKPGRTLTEFRLELEAARAHSPLEQGDAFKYHHVAARPFTDEVIGDVRPTVLLIGAAGLVVLIVASLNVGGLMFVRAGGRIGEIAIRAAIGASRGQVVRALIVEHLAVVGIGVGLGLIGAAIAVPAAGSLLPPDLARARGLTLHLAPVAVSGALAILLGSAAAAMPGLALLRVDLFGALQAGGRGGVRGWGTHGLRRALVTAQIALAVTSVVAAGLLVRTLERLQTIDLGMDPGGLWLVDTEPRTANFDTSNARSRARVDRLTERLAQIPGVRRVAATLQPPFSGNGGFYAKFTTADHGEPSNSPLANYEVVTPQYFATMGMQLRQGRLIDASDREGSVLVAVINETLARVLWPGESPLGKRMAISAAPTLEWSTVVGVVHDTRYNELRTPTPTVYWSYRQVDLQPWYFVIRTERTPVAGSLLRALQRGVAEVDPTSIVSIATPLPALLAKPLATTRVSTMLITLFGVVALGLAAVGLYGVLSSYVLQQTREIGVRMALGADSRDIRTLVARRGVALVAAGLIIGATASLFVNQALTRFLYGVAPSDPLTLITVGVVLLIVAAAAMLLPAHRASRVNPIVALRSD